MQIALELSKIARDTTDKSAIAEFLRDYHKELKDKNTYIEKNFDVIDLFYKNEFEIMQEEFNGILEVIKDIQTFKSFTQGIQKRIIKNGEKIDFKTVTMIRRIIRQSFCGGNLIMQKVLVDYLYFENAGQDKDILWKFFGSNIIANIRSNKNQTIISFPFKDEDGDIEYLGHKYKRRYFEIETGDEN